MGVRARSLHLDLCKVEGLRFWDSGLFHGLLFRAWCSFPGSGFILIFQKSRGPGSGCRVQGLGFGRQGSGFSV